jgi:hypothetical protein
VSRPVTRPHDSRLSRAEPLTRLRTPLMKPSHDRKKLIESSVERSGRGPSGCAISTRNRRLVVAGEFPLCRLWASARAKSRPALADLDLICLTAVLPPSFEIPQNCKLKVSLRFRRKVRRGSPDTEKCVPVACYSTFEVAVASGRLDEFNLIIINKRPVSSIGRASDS